MVNVGNRYICSNADRQTEVLVQDVARALEEEMHIITNAKFKDLERDLDNKINELKAVFYEIIRELGHEISMEDIDQIFKEKISERMPF